MSISPDVHILTTRELEEIKHTEYRRGREFALKDNLGDETLVLEARAKDLLDWADEYCRTRKTPTYDAIEPLRAALLGVS